MAERALLMAALCAYAWVWWGAWRPPRGGSAGVVAGLAVGVTLHAASLIWRWQTLGHGPFTTMHEILSSSLWSLSLVLVLGAARLPEVRVALRMAVPVLAVLAAWMLMADARPGHLPPTYDTPLLYVHTIVGKVFLGLMLTAVSLSTLPLLRRSARAAAPGSDDERCTDLAHRFAAGAFVCHSLMLIVGAVWAQDAWGRYWAWDPLETWAFLTWLALAAALHARITMTTPSSVQALWWSGVFVLAFLTFFGVPFLSTSPHKGAV
jgi:Cytochrome C assembly protein